MKNAGFVLLFIVLAAVAFVGLNSVYTVQQTQQALLLEFGRIVGKPIKQPGLKFKIPFIQKVVYLDNRILVHDNEPVVVDVGENERLVVDAFARYRIVDPVQFYQTVRDKRTLSSRLKVFLDSSIREIVGDVGLNAVISGERRNVMERINAKVQRAADNARLGIKVVDVRIMRADLPQQNMNAVFSRMRTEREKEAQLTRAKGEQKKREITSEADRTVAILMATAQRRAEQTKGEGDRFRNAIFSCAYGVDPNFFAFYRSMQAYEKTFEKSSTSMVLSPNSQFFKFFGNPKGQTMPENSGPSAGAAVESGRADSDPACRADGTYNLSKIPFLRETDAEVARLDEQGSDIGPNAGKSTPLPVKSTLWTNFLRSYPVCGEGPLSNTP